MDGMKFNRDPIPFAKIITTFVEFIKNEHPEDDFRVIEVDDVLPMSGVTTRIPEKMLGYEGLSSGGNKLNLIFITVEVTFTKPNQPTKREQETREMKPMGHLPNQSQTQKTPSPSLAFIKEKINVLRTMIKEHDQQAKMKATSRKLAYADSNKEAPVRSLARGFSDRFSLESFGTSNTHRQTHSVSKSQRTPSKNKEPTHLRMSRRLEDQSITKEKARRERSKSRRKGPNTKRQAWTLNMRKVQKMLIKT
ncbi:hypothetical protein Tco_0984206 [Tanacetum coccineum]